MRRLWTLFLLCMCITLCASGQMVQGPGQKIIVPSAPETLDIFWSDCPVSVCGAIAYVNGTTKIVFDGHGHATIQLTYWYTGNRSNNNYGVNGTPLVGVPAALNVAGPVAIPSLPLPGNELIIEEYTTSYFCGIFCGTVPAQTYQTGPGSRNADNQPHADLYWENLPMASLVSLQGTINYANGKGFNGQIQLTTTKSTVINKCANPVQIVPTARSVPVVNGAVSLTEVYATNCLQPTLPYLAKLIDSNNEVVFVDNWFLPQTTTGIIDVGTMIATNYAAGVTVSLPIPIISTPPGNQSIVQPPGTALTINNLVVTNPISGSVTSLAGTPTVCGAGQVARGIANNGNAICTTIGTGVTTFNGRVGDVVPTTGDYSYSMISGVPTLYFQKLYWFGSLQAQKQGIDFNTSFALSNEGSPDAIGVGLASVVTAATCANPASITYNSAGQVTGCTPASGTPSSGSYTFGNGLIMQWKTGTLQTDSSGTQPINYPITCPTSVLAVIPGSTAQSFNDTSMPIWTVISKTNTTATLAMQRVPDHGYVGSTPTIFVICN